MSASKKANDFRLLRRDFSRFGRSRIALRSSQRRRCSRASWRNVSSKHLRQQTGATSNLHETFIEKRNSESGSLFGMFWMFWMFSETLTVLTFWCGHCVLVSISRPVGTSVGWQSAWKAIFSSRNFETQRIWSEFYIYKSISDDVNQFQSRTLRNPDAKMSRKSLLQTAA